MAVMLRSRRVSQVGRAGQEPSCRELDGGGWRRRRLGWLPGREDRAPAQALAQNLEAKKDDLQPQQPPGAIPAAQPELTPWGKAGGQYTSLAPPGHLPLFPADPTPLHGGGSSVQTPAPGTVGQCPQGDGSAAPLPPPAISAQGEQPGQNVYAALTPSPKRSRGLL